MSLNLRRFRTTRLRSATRLIARAQFGRPVQPGLTVRELVARLPDILAGRDLRRAARAIALARRSGRGVVLGMGAHPLKVGLAPLIVGLLRDGIVTGVAMNGAGIIHDFELAAVGATSEDVGLGLGTGRFGTARETADFLLTAIHAGNRRGLGIGRAVGERLRRSRLPYRSDSVLCAAATLAIPATVHVALGTDTLHMHPRADGAAIGAATLRDFRLLARMIAALDRGVFINLGSAVVIPEVFLKALTLARNLGHPVRHLTTLDMDFQRHYRPQLNVVERPTAHGGTGIHLTGHHEIMLPLLAAAVAEELAA